MESDSGTFVPTGVDFTGNEKAQKTMREVLTLLQPIGPVELLLNGVIPNDPSFFIVNDKVPGIELHTQDDRYFWYHHSNADTMTALNSTELDLCTVTYATIAFIVADLDELLPR